MMSSFSGAKTMHGPFGLGPTGRFEAKKVPLLEGRDGSVAGPWSLVRYFRGAQPVEMQWWSISPDNGRTLFSFDEYGVCNVLKYVYDIIYLLTHEVRWDWELTLDNIVDAAQKFGTWNNGRALLRLAQTQHVTKKANEHTHRVLGAFFERLAAALPEDAPNSPNAHVDNAPASPARLEDDAYDPVRGLAWSDEDEDEETAPQDRDPWGFESDEDDE